MADNYDEMVVDVVTFQDDDGNEFDMEIVDEFEYNGKKYAVLAEITDEDEEDPCEACEQSEEACEGCDANQDALYIFEVVDGAEGEEFVAIDDDDLLDELSSVVEDMLFGGEDEE